MINPQSRNDSNVFDFGVIVSDRLAFGLRVSNGLDSDRDNFKIHW